MNRQNLNIMGLIGGFGIGQGALFLAQTSLLISGELIRLGQFGLAFTMFTLVYQGGDFGGLVILSRELHSRADPDDIGRFFWSFSLFRFVILFGFLMITCALAYLANASPFDTAYVLGASLGLMLASVNPGGLLDGHGLSGLTGLSSSCPFLISAIALPFALPLSDGYAGLALGLAFTLGAMISVAAQFAGLARFGLTPRYRWPARALFWTSGKEGMIYLLAWLPGQLYFRVELWITSAALGVAQAGILLYAKQVIMIPTRLLYFARRVEFPMLVKDIRQGGAVLTVTLSRQRMTIILSLVCAVAVCVGGLVGDFFFREQLHGAGMVIAMFSPIIVAAALAATLSQGCFACRNTAFAAWASVATVGLGIGLQVVLIERFGMASIAISNVVSNLACAAAIAWFLHSRVTTPRVESPSPVAGEN